MSDIDPPYVGTAMRVAKFLTDMKKRDLLLLGFISMFVLFIGVAVGWIPSPFLVAMAQHEMIIKNQASQEEVNTQLVELFRLELYLSRESCMHTAKTDPEKTRCDRQSIRDAILGDMLPNDSATSNASLLGP